MFIESFLSDEEFCYWVKDDSSKVKDYLVVYDNNELYKEYCELRFGKNCVSDIIYWIGNKGGWNKDGGIFDLRIKENYSLERSNKDEQLFWLSRLRLFGYDKIELRNRIFTFEGEEYEYEKRKDYVDRVWEYGSYKNVYQGYGIGDNGGSVDYLIRNYLKYDVDCGRVRIMKVESKYYFIWIGNNVMDNKFYDILCSKGYGDVYTKYLINSDLDMRGIKLSMKYWRNEFLVEEKWILSNGEWINNRKRRLGIRILGEVKNLEKNVVK